MARSSSGSSQPLASDQTGWDWCSLHLNSGDKLMLYRMRQTDGHHYGSGKWIAPDGNAELLASAYIDFRRQVFTEIAGLQVEPDQLAHRHSPARSLRSFAWLSIHKAGWERIFLNGKARSSLSGSHDGLGYLEMTGY